MSAVPNGRRAARRVARVCGLAAAAIACAAPSPTRDRERALGALVDRLEPPLAIAPAARATGAELFAGEALLSRAALVEAVLARNPNLESARQAFRAALARPAQERSLDDPMLGLGVAPLSFGSRRVDPAGRIDVSQRLPFPGKLRLRGEAALAEAEAVGRDLESLRQGLALAASQLFDDHRLAARALAINREHTAVLGELQAVALARYAAGDGAKADVLAAELARGRALYEASRLETEARLVEARLNALLHRDAGLPLPPAARETGAEPHRETEIERGHAAARPADSSGEEAANGALTALAERPELAAAQARERAAEARVSLARREFLPDVTLVGAYDRLWQESPLAPFVGVQLNIPLQRGRRRAALDESQALLESTRARLAALEDDVRLAVESAHQELAQARRDERLVRDRMLPAALDQVATARGAYAAGNGGFDALIDALRELHEIELTQAESEARLSQKAAALDRALGRSAGRTGEKP